MIPQTNPKLKILFLCTGNSCRSQMAEGWTRHLKSDTIDAYSARVEPHAMNSLAIKAMAQAGVDISRHTSKHVDSLAHISFDYVVTVCGHANETCPQYLGRGGNTKIIHVGFDDPPALAQSAATPEEAFAHYTRVRDEIRDWIMTLPDSLARTRLAAPRNKSKPGVLVLCTGNSARSQIAEALLKKFAGDRFDIHSAGMAPAENIHPLAIQVMDEIGIDIRGQWPKATRAYLGFAWFKYVLIVCPENETSCPRIFIGATHRLLWPLDNPAAASGTDHARLQTFRQVRDQLQTRIQNWLKQNP